MGQLGLTDGNCFEMLKAIKGIANATKHYAAAGALVFYKSSNNSISALFYLSSTNLISALF